MYRVEVPDDVAKVLRQLPKEQRRDIGYAIDRLSLNPRPHGAKKMKAHKNRYRIRIGDWRVIYSIEDDKLFVLVIHVGDRKEVYR